MKCKKCGNKLRQNETFCTVCGNYNDSDDDIPVQKKQEEYDLTKDEWNLKEESEIEEDIEEKELDEILKEPQEITEKTKNTKKYIGEDYFLIKHKVFNIWAFLFNWVYFVYRKLYITGIVLAIITCILTIILKEKICIFIAVTSIISGFVFNKYYTFAIEKKVKNIADKYMGSDSRTLEQIYKKKGGVNIIIPLILYLIFLLIIVLNLTNFNFSINKTSNFFNENSENKANCKLLLKSSYQYLEENHKDSYLEEAACKIIIKNNKEYDLYFKILQNNNINYLYFKAYDEKIKYIGSSNELIKLQEKTTLTKEEIELKNELMLIKSNYDSIYINSKEEDKLIKNGKDKKEKVNYIITRLEVIQ